jgi:hypothetical protein
MIHYTAIHQFIEKGGKLAGLYLDIPVFILPMKLKAIDCKPVLGVKGKLMREYEGMGLGP